MTGTAYRTNKVNHSSAQQHNYLGDKLHKKFRGRVSSAVHKAALAESGAIKTAKNGMNPLNRMNISSRINPFENIEPKKASPNYVNANAYSNIGRAALQSEAPQKTRVGSISAQSRPQSQQSLPKEESRRRTSAEISANTKEAAKHRAEAEIKARNTALKIERKRVKAERAKAKKIELAKEIKQTKNRVSVSMIMIMAICTLMVMIIIYSFAQIYEYTIEISTLEKKVSTLEKKEAELKLDLEIRDDIRAIESIATGTIGMVKSDLVQKRFVSLNDKDDKIEIFVDLTENTNSESSSPLNKISTLLSAVSENFGQFMEYIK